MCSVFSVSQSSFDVLLVQYSASLEVSLVFFEDSLKDAGSSLVLGSSVYGSVDFGVNKDPYLNTTHPTHWHI